MLERTVGIVCILISFWQFYSVKNVFVQTKNHGTKNTSNFLPLALLSGVVFGIAMLVGGIALLFKQI